MTDQEKNGIYTEVALLKQSLGEGFRSLRADIANYVKHLSERDDNLEEVLKKQQEQLDKMNAILDELRVSNQAAQLRLEVSKVQIDENRTAVRALTEKITTMQQDLIRTHQLVKLLATVASVLGSGVLGLVLDRVGILFN